jgi:hypothetical protein
MGIVMNESPQPIKPRFIDLCKLYQLDSSLLHSIAETAHVSYSIAYTMFIGDPVARADAENMLVAFSQYVGKLFTLDTVAVPLFVPETKAQPQSEVARLLTEIQEEYNSARLGLSGLAQGTSQHLFITRRMENIGKLHQNLGALVGGEDEAMAMICEHLVEGSDAAHSS